MSFSRILPLLALCLTALFIALFVMGGLQVKLMTVPEPWLPAPDSLEPALISLPENNQEVDSQILERPLFWAGRRPYVPDEEDVSSPVEAVRGPDLLDKVKLLGAYMAEGSAGVIIDIEGVRERLLIGDSVGEWTLMYMNSTGAVFGRGQQEGGPGTTRTLSLEHAMPAASARSPQLAVDRRPLQEGSEVAPESPVADTANEG